MTQSENLTEIIPLFDQNNLNEISVLYPEGNPDAEEIEDRIIELRNSNVERIILCGGEPTIRPDFLDIVTLCAREDSEIIVATNGLSLSYGDFIEECSLVGVDVFRLRLWSHDPILFNFLAGDESAYDLFRNAVHNLKEQGKRIEFDIPITPQNEPFVEELVGFALEFSPERIFFHYPETRCMNQANFREAISRLNLPIKYDVIVNDLLMADHKCIRSIWSFRRDFPTNEFLKVGIVNWSLSILNPSRSGGTEKVEIDMLSWLREIGIDARIYSRVDHALDNIIPCGKKGGIEDSNSRESFEEMSSRDILYYRSVYDKSIGELILHCMNSPLMAVFAPHRAVVHIHNECTVPRSDGLYKGYLGGHYVFNSKSMQSQFAAKNPWLRTCQTYILYNGIGPAYFRQSNVRRTSKVILYPSSWEEHKGLFFFLKVIRQLERVRGDFHVLIAGSKDLYNLNLDIAAREKRESYTHERFRELTDGLKTVEILGPQDYSCMPKLYGRADFVVVPSLWEEPFGLVALEAMAAGCVVVASDCGGLPEIIDPGRNGFLARKGKLHSWVRLLDGLLDSDLDDIRQGAPEKAKQFSRWRFLNKLLGIYNEVFGVERSSHALLLKKTGTNHL